MNRFCLIILSFFLLNAIHANGLQNHLKKRVIVLTDIGDNPGDTQSLVRFLTYSNMFDIEGIIATTSLKYPSRTNESKIMSLIDAYSKVRDNLALHENGFLDGNNLLKVSQTGGFKYGMEGIGHYANSEGSASIINSLKKEDDRPLWILIWGGPNTLAQALWRLEITTSKEEFRRITDKLRIYAISDHDETGPWIRNTYPDIFYICSPGYTNTQTDGSHFATWAGISGDKTVERFSGGNQTVISAGWIANNIQNKHGELGAIYPNTDKIMEGDTPSFLYLIDNGLNNSEYPNQGSWGGRYDFYTPNTKEWYYTSESRPFWTNAEDEVLSPVDQKYHTGIHETIWRWREAFQNDFAARMDWCTKTYEEANHPPVPELNIPSELTVYPGDTIFLKAADGYDPDGDELSYRWEYYREAGNSVYWLGLNNSTNKKAWFIAPECEYPNYLHFILELTDNGSPKLTRYKRVIVKVEPKVIKPRVIVTTDGEIDDKSSFIRYLLYSNEFETEGLIYGNSKWQPNGNGIAWMNSSINIYEKYRVNLLKHMDGYPSAKELNAVVFDGNRDINYLNYTGSRRTVGAQHIIDVLLDKDPRPVWVQAWGGTNTIAQALSILNENYFKEDVKYALNKLKIYAIADQDSTSEWIRNTFPDVFYIRSNQFTALNYQHAGHPFSNLSIFSEKWMTENVKTNHGDLGAKYPQAYFSEGDSPAFFHLIGNGLRAEENPEYGGWGGRYESSNSTHFFDASDDSDQLKPQWRWLLDIQNDFAARMDWCINDYENANHYPEIGLDCEENIEVLPCSKITIDASGSIDPDGDKLSYEWYFYSDASTFSEMPALNDNHKANLKFTIPAYSEDGELHLILEVADNGEPALKQYKRIILKVQP